MRIWILTNLCRPHFLAVNPIVTHWRTKSWLLHSRPWRKTRSSGLWKNFFFFKKILSSNQQQYHAQDAKKTIEKKNNRKEKQIDEKALKRAQAIESALNDGWVQGIVRLRDSGTNDSTGRPVGLMTSNSLRFEGADLNEHPIYRENAQTMMEWT